MILLWTTSNSPVSWMIRKYTNFKASHIAIAIKHQDGTHYVYEAVSRGVVKSSLNDFKRKNKVVDEINLRNVYPYLNDISENTVKTIANEFVGINYGHLTLLGIVLNDYFKTKWFADGRRTMICSELVWRLMNVVIPESLQFSKIPDFVTPKDVWLFVINASEIMRVLKGIMLKKTFFD